MNAGNCNYSRVIFQGIRDWTTPIHPPIINALFTGTAKWGAEIVANQVFFGRNKEGPLIEVDKVRIFGKLK